MSYLVTVTFDLKNASAEDYTNVYEAFAKLGLHQQLKADNGAVVQLPTTTCVGTFTGTTAGSVRDDMANRCETAIEQLGLSGEVFVVVGGNWAWGHRTPKAPAKGFQIKMR